MNLKQQQLFNLMEDTLSSIIFTSEKRIRALNSKSLLKKIPIETVGEFMQEYLNLAKNTLNQVNEYKRICPVCHGESALDGDDCSKCNNTGFVI